MSQTDWTTEWKSLLIFVSLFLGLFYLPLGSSRFSNALSESLHLVKWYAQEHVLTCLIPAFFMSRYLSPGAAGFTGVVSFSHALITVRKTCTTGELEG